MISFVYLVAKIMLSNVNIVILYHYLYLGAFKAGKVGWMWSNLRCLVYRITDYKIYELRNLGELSYSIDHGPGEPDSRCEQH